MVIFPADVSLKLLCFNALSGGTANWQQEAVILVFKTYFN
jgi:hypothetical protein